MATSPVGSTASQEILTSLGRNATTKETTSADDQQSKFLKLLTAQLKNQDPMNPMDNAETTSQLAQISTVDGVERLNNTLSALMGTFKSSEAFQAAALVGRQVLVEGNRMDLESGMAVAGFDLEGAADKVSVSIFDKNGIEIERRDLDDLDSGSHIFVWNGKTANGTPAVDGDYTIKVNATRGSDKVAVNALEMATVTSAVTGGSEVGLDVGRFGRMSMSDIKRIL